MCGDGIDRVHAVRIGLDWARELKRLQTFGRLASASPADGRVYVDLPEALRVLRPEAVRGSGMARRTQSAAHHVASAGTLAQKAAA